MGKRVIKLKKKQIEETIPEEPIEEQVEEDFNEQLKKMLSSVPPPKIPLPEPPVKKDISVKIIQEIPQESSPGVSLGRKTKDPVGSRSSKVSSRRCF
jgi:hypothetical protein